MWNQPPLSRGFRPRSTAARARCNLPSSPNPNLLTWRWPVSARSGLVLLLSLVFGGSAAVGVNKYVKGGPRAARDPDTVPVVVTVQDIPRGASITAGMVKIRDYPGAMVSPGTPGRV